MKQTLKGSKLQNKTDAQFLGKDLLKMTLYPFFVHNALHSCGEVEVTSPPSDLTGLP